MSKRPRESSPPPPLSPASPPDNEAAVAAKLSRVDTDTFQKPAVFCSERPVCQARPFSSYEEYEVHYAKTHTNRCRECSKNFPTDRFLNLHIQETHDPLSQIRFERGEKIFGCFVDGCDRMCRTPFKRKRHLIDKHHFPGEYNFFVTKDGIDRSISLLNDPRAKARSKSKSGPPRKTSTIDGMSMDSSVPSETGTSSAIKDEDDASVKELSGLMTAMRFVPPSVRFGRRGHK